jgi:hypothetical protein
MKYGHFVITSSFCNQSQGGNKFMYRTNTIYGRQSQMYSLIQEQQRMHHGRRVLGSFRNCHNCWTNYFAIQINSFALNLSPLNYLRIFLSDKFGFKME